ncbi:MAG: hypothetical protein P1S60_15620, partial [Anaerolineae bacterium]|nr:hypothetical protein [Anaerolineae bacterium]
LQLQNKPVENIDYAKIARKTAHFSGADIMGVVDQVVERKLRRFFPQPWLENHRMPTPMHTRDGHSCIGANTSRHLFISGRLYV